MIKIENTQIFGWEGAIRGARNPMNSWEKSDTWFLDYFNQEYETINCHSISKGTGQMESSGNYTENDHEIFEVLTHYEDNEWKTEDIIWPFASDEHYKYPIKLIIGPADHKLLMNLCKGGTEESKWRRMIHVQMDITAPLYWWKEFDTYKVGTVANSCSTMHKIHAKEFTLDDFSCEHLLSDGLSLLDEIIYTLNLYRAFYNNHSFDDPKVPWWQMIQLLPSSYNQKRTIDLNYEVLAAQYLQRKEHKLDCWRQYCEWIKSLPYSEFITMEENKA